MGLLLLGGCWQEIRYDPSAEQAAPVKVDSPPSASGDAGNPPEESLSAELDTAENVTDAPSNENPEQNRPSENGPSENRFSEDLEESTPVAAEDADDESRPTIDEGDASFEDLFGQAEQEADVEGPTEPSFPAEGESPSADESPPETNDTFDELFGPEEEPSLEPAEEPMTDELPESTGSSPPTEAPLEESQQSSSELFAPNESAATQPLRPSRTALAAWRMASRWSLAAELYAKGVDESAYQPNWEQATYAAELLGLSLPPLPKGADDLQTEVITYLMQQGRDQLAIPLAEKFSPEYPALVELAVKSNILLLVYTPKSDQLEPLITDINHAATASGLPEELWKSLVEQLESRAAFEEVKKSVLKLHAAVTDYLAGSPMLETMAPQERQP